MTYINKNDWRSVMSTHSSLPYIGAWYKTPEMFDIFEIVAIDQKGYSIEIQYFTGDLEELDLETWHALNAKEIPTPNDWSGPYELDKEDLSIYLDEDIISNKYELDNPLSYVEPTSYRDLY